MLLIFKLLCFFFLIFLWVLFQELVKKGCEALEKCEDMINKLGLFSANETKDDISTTNLKYSLVIFVFLIVFYFNYFFLFS